MGETTCVVFVATSEAYNILGLENHNDDFMKRISEPNWDRMNDSNTIRLMLGMHLEGQNEDGRYPYVRGRTMEKIGLNVKISVNRLSEIMRHRGLCIVSTHMLVHMSQRMLQNDDSVFTTIEELEPGKSYINNCVEYIREINTKYTNMSSNIDNATADVSWCMKHNTIPNCGSTGVVCSESCPRVNVRTILNAINVNIDLIRYVTDSESQRIEDIREGRQPDMVWQETVLMQLCVYLKTIELLIERIDSKDVAYRQENTAMCIIEVLDLYLTAVFAAATVNVHAPYQNSCIGLPAYVYQRWASEKTTGRIFGVKHIMGYANTANEVDWPREPVKIVRISSGREQCEYNCVSHRNIDQCTGIHIVSRLLEQAKLNELYRHTDTHEVPCSVTEQLSTDALVLPGKAICITDNKRLALCETVPTLECWKKFKSMFKACTIGLGGHGATAAVTIGQPTYINNNLVLNTSTLKRKDIHVIDTFASSTSLHELLNKHFSTYRSANVARQAYLRSVFEEILLKHFVQSVAVSGEHKCWTTWYITGENNANPATFVCDMPHVVLNDDSLFHARYQYDHTDVRLVLRQDVPNTRWYQILSTFGKKKGMVLTHLTKLSFPFNQEGLTTDKQPNLGNMLMMGTC